MSKIEFDTEEQEVTITRKIGRGRESTVTVSPEKAGLQVNLGIVSLGATTDFGGAIHLGVAGQEITWGREGGTIHIGIGGFAVDVEARDCIVTEVKSIFGIIVAQRSYRDPGCKPEKTPDPPDPPKPPPGPNGIDLDTMTSKDTAYVLIENSVFSHSTVSDGKGFTTIIQKVSLKSENLPEIVKPPPYPGAPPLITVLLNSEVNLNRATWYSNPPPGALIRSTARTVVQSRVYSGGYTFYYLDGVINLSEFSLNAGTIVENTRTGPDSTVIQYVKGYVAFGRIDIVGKWIKAQNSLPSSNVSTTYSNVIYKMSVSEVILIGKARKPRPFLPTGNKPPMKDCCEEVLDMLEDIKEAFAVDRILKDKFPVSNTFMAPGCDPASVTKANNYYEVFQCVMRMMAHGMIFEPRVNIKDADAAKAGDQEFKAKYLNATGWASAVAEALLEVKDDGNVSTNMDIRNGFAATQTMVGLADAIYRINAVLDGVGVELIPKVETVDTPYNVQIQIGKGFGEGNERQIDLNTDEATEKLLPTFLQVKKNKIKTVDIHPRSRSLK